MTEQELLFGRHFHSNKSVDKSLEKRQKIIIKRLNTIKKLERLYTIVIKKPKREINSSIGYKPKKILKIQNETIDSFNHKSPFITETSTKDSNVKRELSNERKDNKKNNFQNIINNIQTQNNQFNISPTKNPIRKSTTLSQTSLGFYNQQSKFGIQSNNNLNTVYSKPSSINLWKKSFKSQNTTTINQKFFTRNHLSEKGIKNLSSLKRKFSNPLEISEEDKIFSQYKLELNKKQNQNKKSLYTHNLTEDEKLLENVYRLTPEYFNKIHKAKKKKDKLNLERYQQNLLLTISDTISKDGYKKLKRQFHKIRDKVHVNIEKSNEFIIGLEKKEKKIIKEINLTSGKCEEMMRNTGFSFGLKKFSLPKIKFYRIIKVPKKKNRNYFTYDSDSESRYY